MNKIIITLGPSIIKLATKQYPNLSLRECLKKLFEDLHLNFNVEIFRINLSHYDKNKSKLYVEVINELKNKYKNIKIMIDTKGPELRIVNLKEEMLINENEKIYLSSKKRNNKKELIVARDGYKYPLEEKIKNQKYVLIDDGKLTLKIIGLDEFGSIETIALNNHILKPNKKICLRNFKYGMEFLSKTDIDDILNFNNCKIDIIALSFVKNSNDIIQLKKIINNKNILICSKIESFESLENLNSIIKHSDLIMLARGDLALEIGFENVPEIQNKVSNLCKENNTKYIIATQLLESLTTNLYPTRSEVTDVYYAISNKADYLMLSNETAIGKFVINTLKILNKLIKKYN